MKPVDPKDDVMRMLELEFAADEDQEKSSRNRFRQCPPDTAESWELIAGNSECKEVLRAFVTFSEPGRHILIYGPNRSGKTTMIHLALKAKFCGNRAPDLNPCNNCPNCRRWNAGVDCRYRSSRNCDGHTFKYIAVDGSNPTTYQEDVLCFYRDDFVPLIAYIDEASHPDFIKFMPRLIKPMTERPITLIVSGVRLRPRKDPVTGMKLPGLSKDFVYRFSAINRTTAAAKPESLVWLRRMAAKYKMQPDDDTLSLLLDKSQMIPGQALRANSKS